MNKERILNIMEKQNNQNAYVSLEVLAIRLGLPQSYLKEAAVKRIIPFLDVRGRKRFNPSEVQGALDRIALPPIEKEGSDE